MALSVSEVAALKSVSPRRVLQWIHSGSMRASKVAGVYMVEETELARRRYRGRPMSDKMAWAFIDALSGLDPHLDNDTEKRRLRRYLLEVKSNADPASLLATWLRRRAIRIGYQAQLSSVEDLRQDSRLVASGISDPRSDLSASHELEAYVHPSNLDAVVRDYLLLPATIPNVFLHITDRQIESPVPLGLVLADLADHAGPREDARVEELVKGIES